MAVYERTYRRYEGPITPQTWRFLVLPRYIMKDVFKSRLLVFFYALCFVFPLILSVGIYLFNNLDLLDQFASFSEVVRDLEVDGWLFLRLLRVQGLFALLVAVFVGPGLMSRDLANNGLPLYLSRPISRAEYILGKSSVLFILLSAITWLPGLWLFALQSILDDGDWMTRHFQIAVGLVVGSILWIVLLSLLALAFSAWVKWRPVATFTMFMIFPAGQLFAFMWNVLFHTDWGYIIHSPRLVAIIWAWFLDTDIPAGPPVLAAFVALLAMMGFCLLLLHLKMRAYEVVS